LGAELDANCELPGHRVAGWTGRFQWAPYVLDLKAALRERVVGDYQEAKLSHLQPKFLPLYSSGIHGASVLQFHRARACSEDCKDETIKIDLDYASV
jgi:hypothetical protein